MEEVVKSHWKSTQMVLYDRNHAISHRNPSGEILVCTGRGTPSEISPEGLPGTQNPTGSVSALPLGLPAGTLRGAVLNKAPLY